MSVSCGSVSGKVVRCLCVWSVCILDADLDCSVASLGDIPSLAEFVAPFSGAQLFRPWFKSAAVDSDATAYV